MNERIITIDSVKIELLHDIQYVRDKREVAEHKADCRICKLS